MAEHQKRWLLALPDALLGALFLLFSARQLWNAAPLAGEDLNTLVTALGGPTLATVAAIEALFLVPQLTFVDIATRLRARPRWWLVPPLTLLVVLIAPGGLEAAKTILANQAWLALPAAWSLWLRGQLLWTMPTASDFKRTQTRAEFAGRLSAGLAAVVALLLTVVAIAVWNQEIESAVALGLRLLPAALGFYFLLCAVDILRIQGARFAARPTALFGWDPLGIEYRGPLL